METETEYLITFGKNAGLSVLDVTLLCLCPVFAALGTVVSGTIKKLGEKIDFEEATTLPANRLYEDLTDLTIAEKLRTYNEERKELFEHFKRREKRLTAFRLAFIGFALGVVIALYFVGSITQSITSVARVFALCVLLGYQAPNLWAVQEKVIGKVVEEKLTEALRKKGDTP